MEDRPGGTRARACKSQAGKARDDGDVDDEEEGEEKDEEEEEGEEEGDEEGDEESANDSGDGDSDSDFEDSDNGGPGQYDLSKGHLTIDRDHDTFDSERR